MSYHNPVLFAETIQHLTMKHNGVYIDATFGGGGHSIGLLKTLNSDARLFGFDQDADAAQNTLNDSRFTFIQSNFRDIKRFLRAEGITKVDAILADLGVSSYQLDVPDRGFSYRFDAKLDMRMDQTENSMTAAYILATYSAFDLQRIFGHYGEVRNAKTLAETVVEMRTKKPIQTVSDLLGLLEPLIRGEKYRYLGQVFQALRMEVNQEVAALKDFLQQSLDLLDEGGRLAIISYHSIEDRLVKDFMKTGNFEGEYEKDFYGNIHRPFELITKKAIEPSAAEIKENPRARSAKLRVAKKK